MRTAISNLGFSIKKNNNKILLSTPNKENIEFNNNNDLLKFISLKYPRFVVRKIKKILNIESN